MPLFSPNVLGLEWGTLVSFPKHKLCMCNLHQVSTLVTGFWCPVVTEHRVTSGRLKDGHSGSMWLTTHRSETRSKTASKFNINSVLDQPSLGLFIFSLLKPPFCWVSINHYHNIPKPSRTLAKKMPFFPKRTRSGKRRSGQFSQTFWDCFNPWDSSVVQVQQRSYDIPKLSETLANTQQTMHCSEPGPRVPSNLTYVLYWISYCLASFSQPSFSPRYFLLQKPPFCWVWINHYHKIPKPSKTLAKQNALFFPNILGLERGTLVRFSKLSETAWTTDEVALCKCNRGAMKFPNFQRPWPTYSRQCTVLNQVLWSLSTGSTQDDWKTVTLAACGWQRTVLNQVQDCLQI